MVKYQHTVEAKSLKNVLKHGQSCISFLEKALELTDYMGAKEKKPYIFEYLALTSALIGTAYLEAKNLQKAQGHYLTALNHNKKSLGNEDTYMRQTFIHLKLLALRIQQNDPVQGLNHAEIAFKTVKKVKDSSKVFPYLQELKNFYIRVEDGSTTEKVFIYMIQSGKTVKNNPEWHQTRAGIYSDYGDFLLKVDKSEKVVKKAEKLYKKALKIYQKTGLNDKIREIQAKLKQNKPE